MSYTISIVIPAYNEERTLPFVLNRVHEVQIQHYNKEIIVVNDGSTDGTVALFQKKEYQNMTLINLPCNKGKTDALKEGITQSTGNLVLIQDADLEYDPVVYPLLLSLFDNPTTDVVFGSRFMKQPFPHGMSISSIMANNLLTFLSNRLNGYSLTDVETGCKIFKGDLLRDIAKDLTATGFGFEIEVVARLAKRGAVIREVAIPYTARNRKQGKHIGFMDGLQALRDVFTYNLFT